MAWGDTVFIPAGSAWRYLDDGSDQGTAWRSSGFDDSSWQGGAAQLGYGGNGEVTTLDYGGISTNKHITYYFRRLFVVDDPARYLGLVLRLLRDDGAVVYLNGNELRRDNMPGGPVSHLTWASAAVGGADETTFYATQEPLAGLASGTNVLAVELHQAAPTSSDLGFDLELIGQTMTQLVARGAAWSYLDDGSDQGTAWREPGFDAGSWAAGSAKLGYGDGNQATLLGYGPDANNKYITCYFRHDFELADPAGLVALNMELLRDDGAVVYLNGTEIWRDNMPATSVDYLATALLAVGGADEDTYFEKGVGSAGLLVAGSNTLAVELHQVSGTSSDTGFDFSLAAATEFPRPELTRGPYLQLGTPTSVAVRWRTDLPTNSVVRFGTSWTNLNFVSQNGLATTEHEVILVGLEPGTAYYYSIGYGAEVLAGADSRHVYHAPPVPGTPRRHRVWVLGDSGTANANARAVRDAYYAWTTNQAPDLWLMLGDNAYNDGTDAEFQAAVFEMYTNTLHRSVLWPTLGNHDGHTADSATQTGPYYDMFTLPRNGEAGGLASGTEAYYSFDHLNVHYVCLDSYETDRSTNGAMLVWMQADLAATTQDWVVAFWHHPPYSRGSHNSDTDAYMTDMRRNALPLLEQAGVDLVLTGHSHSYERSVLIHDHYGVASTLTPAMITDAGDGRTGGDGAYDKTLATGSVYVVAGSSGKISGGSLNHPVMHVSLNELGSMVLDVEGRRLDATFIDAQGEVRDFFTLVKDSPVYTLSTEVAGQGQIAPAGGSYVTGSVVTLSAAPSNYFLFARWTGGVEGVVSPVDLAMDGDKHVTGVFDPILVTNGVPQWWLVQYGLGTSDEDALADQDVDGAFTWAEYMADTVPVESNSYFSVEQVGGGPAVSVVVSSSAGRVYRLEAADSPSGTWFGVSGQVDMAGSNGLHVLTDPAPGASGRFYRVGVRLP
jgi:hypothetical protein